MHTYPYPKQTTSAPQPIAPGVVRGDCGVVVRGGELGGAWSVCSVLQTSCPPAEMVSQDEEVCSGGSRVGIVVV